jgi:small-conductance mechanosensitive channel
MKFTRDLVILAATALAWFAYALTINSPGGFAPLVVETARNAALVLSGIALVRLAALALVDGLVERVWGIPSTALMRFLVHFVLGVTAAAVILKYGNDFNITTLLTTSALITVILGIAAQSTMAALLSGIALQLERNIRAGDAIRVDNRLGRVEVVGWRSISVRRADGILIIVPNTIFATHPMPLIRPGSPVRSEAVISAPVAVPPSVVADIIGGAVAGIAEVSRDHPIAVDFHASRSQEALVDYRVRCFGRSAGLDDDPLAPTMRLRVWYAYQRHGIVEPRWPLIPQSSALLPPTALANLAPEASTAGMAAALAGTRRWHRRNAADLEGLLRRGRRLLFAPDEPILLPRDLDYSVVTLVAGNVQSAGPISPVSDWIEPPVTQAHDRGPAVDWDFEKLLEVESQLGRAIGPYARLAVRQAARDTADLATLYRRLADLIRDPSTRDAFLRNAPQDGVGVFGPGTVFAVRCAGRGLAAPGGALIARGEVELLAIPADQLSEAPQDELSSAS